MAEKYCETCAHYCLTCDADGANIKKECSITHHLVSGELVDCLQARLNPGMYNTDGPGNCTPDGYRWVSRISELKGHTNRAAREKKFMPSNWPHNNQSRSCCDAWEQARSYDRPMVWKDPDGIFINGSRYPVKFCPWCGKEK